MPVWAQEDLLHGHGKCNVRISATSKYLHNRKADIKAPNHTSGVLKVIGTWVPEHAHRLARQPWRLLAFHFLLNITVL